MARGGWSLPGTSINHRSVNGLSVTAGTSMIPHPPTHFHSFPGILSNPDTTPSTSSLPHPQHPQDPSSLPREVQRVLAAGGHWIVVSHSGPEQREALMTGPEGVGKVSAQLLFPNPNQDFVLGPR